MARSALPTNGYRREAIPFAFTTTTGVTWGGTGNSALDVYWPTATASRPVICLLHGAWSGSRTGSLLPTLAQTFAQSGFCTFLADFYELPSSSGNTSSVYRQGMIDDIKTLMTWIRANAGTYNGDVSKVAILGESAGGQLALMAGIQGVAGGTRPDAIATWSLPARLDSTAFASGGSHALAGPAVNNYLGTTDQSTGADAVIARSFSPYNQVSVNLPPIRLAVGNAESNIGVPQSDVDDMQTAAISAGVDSTKRVLITAIHAVFNGLDDYATASWLATKMPWTRANSRSSAGSRSAAGDRAAV